MRLKLGLIASLVLCAACSQGAGGGVVPQSGPRPALATAAAQTYDSAVMADVPTQYFALNEPSGPTVYDGSATGINGAYLGAVTFGLAGPLLNQTSTAIAIPGGAANAGVQLPAPPASASGSYTIQTWVYPLASTQYMTIWGYSATKRLLLTPSGLLLSQFNGSYFSARTLSRNQWHDVAFVYNAATQTAQYYIDGEPDSTASIPKNSAAFTSPYFLGQYSTGTYYRWNGRLARHAFYASALTASQVASLHTAGGYAAAPAPVPTPTSTAAASPAPTTTPVPTATPTPTPSPTPAPVTIPYFSSAFSYGGTTYKYKMVGTNPATTPASTTIGVEIVPVKFEFSDGVSFDATNAASAIPQTPLFQNANYAAGTTQYGDAYMRSQFWNSASGTNYHVLLGTPVVEPTQTIIVPAADGYTGNTPAGTNGYVTYDWFVQTIEPQLIQQLGIDPRTLTIFATASTKVVEPGGHCCYSGYHSAHQMTTAWGPSIATTAWASVSTTDVRTLSHEIGEWFDDPFYTNVVPKWTNPISNTCDGNALENGDPVTNRTFTVNGTVLQDLVYFSWFSHDSPSLGIGGSYDFMNQLTAPATQC